MRPGVRQTRQLLIYLLNRPIKLRNSQFPVFIEVELGQILKTGNPQRGNQRVDAVQKFIDRGVLHRDIRLLPGLLLLQNFLLLLLRFDLLLRLLLLLNLFQLPQPREHLHRAVFFLPRGLELLGRHLKFGLLRAVPLLHVDVLHPQPREKGVKLEKLALVLRVDEFEDLLQEQLVLYHEPDLRHQNVEVAELDLVVLGQNLLDGRLEQHGVCLLDLLLHDVEQLALDHSERVLPAAAAFQALDVAAEAALVRRGQQDLAGPFEEGPDLLELELVYLVRVVCVQELEDEPHLGGGQVKLQLAKDYVPEEGQFEALLRGLVDFEQAQRVFEVPLRLIVEVLEEIDKGSLFLPLEMVKFIPDC